MSLQTENVESDFSKVSPEALQERMQPSEKVPEQHLEAEVLCQEPWSKSKEL